MAAMLSNFGASTAARVIEMDARHTVTLDELVGMAWAVYDQAMKGTPIMDEHGQTMLFDGEPLFAPDHASANRAIEIVARLCGFMVERREVTIHTPDGKSGHIAEVVSLHAVDGEKDGNTA